MDIVQINTSKIKINNFGKEKARKLENHINQLLTNTEQIADTVTCGENYDTLCLHYNDGTKRLFVFFEKDSEWYMEDFGGTIYSEADFITEYINQENSEEKGGNTSVSPNTSYLNLYQEFETFDMNYYFLVKMLEEINYGTPEKSAFEHVRNEMLHEIYLYKYSISHGIKYTSSEASELMDKFIKYVENSHDYDSIKEIFADCNITWKEYAEKDRESFNIKITIDKLYQSKREEFRHGYDTVGNQKCDNFEEFWYTFVNDEVYKEMKLYDLSDIENQLTEAEKFYNEYKDKLVQ